MTYLGAMTDEGNTLEASMGRETANAIFSFIYSGTQSVTSQIQPTGRGNGLLFITSNYFYYTIDNVTRIGALVARSV
jgi:hypothetical protein